MSDFYIAALLLPSAIRKGADGKIAQKVCYFNFIIISKKLLFFYFIRNFLHINSIYDVCIEMTHTYCNPFDCFFLMKPLASALVLSVIECHLQCQLTFKILTGMKKSLFGSPSQNFSI